MTTAREAALAARQKPKPRGLYALVGMKHRGAEALVASLPQGEPLTLVRDPQNPHDPSAVEVWARGQHIGFIRATQVRPLAARMDSLARGGQEPPQAKLAIDGGGWPMVEVLEG